MPRPDASLLQEATKQCASLLRDAGVPYALTGGMAMWTHGAAVSDHDVDFIIEPQSRERAKQTLSNGGCDIQHVTIPDWLDKAYWKGILIDLIYRDPTGHIDSYMERAGEEMVHGVRMRVMQPDDVLIMKLSSLNELHIDYEKPLQWARSLREQIDWQYVRSETKELPFAQAFLGICDDLGLS